MPTKFVDEDPPDNPSYKWQRPQCTDPDHNPPSMIVIPPGKKMIHTCPSCGRVTVVHKQVTFCHNN